MPRILRKSIIIAQFSNDCVERNQASGIVLVSVGFLTFALKKWPGIAVPIRNKQSVAVGLIN